MYLNEIIITLLIIEIVVLLLALKKVEVTTGEFEHIKRKNLKN